MSEQHRRLALLCVVLALALFCAAGLLRAIAIVPLQVPLDPNEGWNAYHAAAAMAGGPLYPGPRSFMVNNYPPLSFYLVGALGRVVGDDIVAGRIVSLLALGAIAWGLFAVARRMGCRKSEAALAPLLFAGGLLVFTDYVGMDDPQLLAHAVAMAGFLLLLREPRGARAVVAAALLFVLAVFVKHNVIAMAVSATAWLALYHRRDGVRLAVSGLAFLLCGLVLFRLVYGTGLLAELGSARTYSLGDLLSGLESWLHWSLIPLLGLAVLAALCGCDRFVRLVALYAALATLLGAGLLGGAGVDANVLFDADMALALGAALVLNRFAERIPPALLAGAYALPLFVAAWSNVDWRDLRHPLRDEARLAQTDIAFLAARRGPALCEMQSFCYWARKEAAVDVFNIGEQFETGARGDAELVGLIAASRFAVIQFDPDSPYSLGQGVHDAVERRYRLDHADDYGAFYVPR